MKFSINSSYKKNNNNKSSSTVNFKQFKMIIITRFRTKIKVLMDWMMNILSCRIITILMAYLMLGLQLVIRSIRKSWILGLLEGIRVLITIIIISLIDRSSL